MAAALQSRDTVSQPVASTQRPGRIYHADDFAPGLQCRREPPLVASAVSSRKAESYAASMPAGDAELQPNGHADHGAAALGSKPHVNGLSSEQSDLEPISHDTPASQPDGDTQPKARKPQKPKVPPKPKAKAKPAAARQARDDSEPAAPSADVSGQQPEVKPPTTDAAAAVEPQKAAPMVLDGVQRDVEALAQCMACDICREVLLDPVHASTCMHCYCRDCIDAFLVLGGTSNCCPVCRRADVATSLGRDPYKDNLKLDFVLANLIRKVRRPASGDAILQRRLADRLDGSSLFPLQLANLPVVQAEVVVIASVEGAQIRTEQQQIKALRCGHHQLALPILDGLCLAGLPRPSSGRSVHGGTATKAFSPQRSAGEPASQQCRRNHGPLSQAAADRWSGRGRGLRVRSR